MRVDVFGAGGEEHRKRAAGILLRGTDGGGGGSSWSGWQRGAPTLRRRGLDEGEDDRRGESEAQPGLEELAAAHAAGASEREQTSYTSVFHSGNLRIVCHARGPHVPQRQWKPIASISWSADCSLAESGAKRQTTQRLLCLRSHNYAARPTIRNTAYRLQTLLLLNRFSMPLTGTDMM